MDLSGNTGLRSYVLAINNILRKEKLHHDKGNFEQHW